MAALALPSVAVALSARAKPPLAPVDDGGQDGALSSLAGEERDGKPRLSRVEIEEIFMESRLPQLSRMSNDSRVDAESALLSSPCAWIRRRGGATSASWAERSTSSLAVYAEGARVAS